MVNCASENDPLCGGRDCSYCRPPGLRDSRAGRDRRPGGAFKGSGTIMKKVAIVTVAVLALGLAACNKNEAANNAANETAVENTAAVETNAATNEATNAANNALNAPANETAGNAVANASTNK